MFDTLDEKGKLSPKKWGDLSLVQKGVAIAATGGLVFIIYTLATRDPNIRQVPVNPDLLTYTTSTGQTAQWNPDPLSKEFYENLDGGWNLYVYPETTDKLNKLNDEQIKALYNHYNAYYAEDEPTLTKLIEGEWSPGPSYRQAVARLKSLGLH